MYKKVSLTDIINMLELDKINPEEILIQTPEKNNLTSLSAYQKPLDVLLKFKNSLWMFVKIDKCPHHINDLRYYGDLKGEDWFCSNCGKVFLADENHVASYEAKRKDFMEKGKHLLDPERLKKKKRGK